LEKKDIKMCKDEKIKINYPLAKNHHLIQIAPQFRPIKRGARRKGIEREYISKDGKNKVKVMMWKELDIADQDLLLAILAIALPIERGISITRLINEEIEEKKEKYKQLWEKLETKGILAKYDTIVINTSFYELAKELGRPSTSKNIYKWIKDSLTRLSGTRFEIENERYVYNSNLISYLIDKDTNKIEIALNPLNALILMDDKKGYILHNRKERIKLKGEVAKALHAVLVGLVNQKSSKTFKLDILVEKVYLEKIENMSIQQRKDARKAIKKALEKINELDSWKIKNFDNKTYQIKRL
jgi:hypothetical protein